MAVVLWAVLILALGGQDFSAEATGGWLEGLLRTFFPDVDPGRLEPVHFVSRKAAHLIEYAVLGLLSYHALALDGPSAVTRPALLALLLVAGDVLSTMATRRCWRAARDRPCSTCGSTVQTPRHRALGPEAGGAP